MKELKDGGVQLGQRGRDVLTGYEGLCTARTKFLTGCDHVLLLPTKLDKDGKRQDGEWFDVTRVEVVGEVEYAYDKSEAERGQRRIVTKRPGADEKIPKSFSR